MESSDTPTCPFCGVEEKNDYQLLLHVEVYHSENGNSPFAVKDEIEARQQEGANHQDTIPSGASTPSSTETDFVECPYKCGERVSLSELPYHNDFHLAEELAMEEPPPDVATATAFSTDIPRALRNREQIHGKRTDRGNTSQQPFIPSLKQLLFPSQATQTKSNSGHIRRLSKAELGPYASERRMPNWLIDLLQDGGKVSITNTIGPNGNLVRRETISNETPDLVPVLAHLSRLDKDIARAFYCDVRTTHVAKLPKEGGFCGYRNIQMQISYIRDAQAPGYQHFQNRRLPSILRLQDMIEDAWDRGIHAAAREETGGIRLTRKYIGTAEAQALYLSLGMNSEALAFSSSNKKDAYLAMMGAVCSYFDDTSNASGGMQKVVLTSKPPLFFQHQGHSMTVVGVEVDTQGRANLVVFDPTYNPAGPLKKLAMQGRTEFRVEDPAKLLKAHRRDERYLGRHRAFEIVKVEAARGSGAG